MNLKAVIAGIYKTYSDSVAVLSSYVRDIDEAIQKIQADQEGIVKKLVAAKAGEPDPSKYAPGEKLITLDLHEDQVDLIYDAMKFAQSHTAAYPNVAFRTSFIYLIALFDAFLSDTFEAVVQSRPDILKSKKQITYERVLEFASMQSLVEYLAKRELNELSYKSLNDQADYYQDRFGLSLADSGVSIDALVELRATRNLLVHNNGVVNHIYLEQVTNTTYKLGDSVLVDSAYFASAIRNLNNVAAYVAAKLTEKHAK